MFFVLTDLVFVTQWWLAYGNLSFLTEHKAVINAKSFAKSAPLHNVLLSLQHIYRKSKKKSLLSFTHSSSHLHLHINTGHYHISFFSVSSRVLLPTSEISLSISSCVLKSFPSFCHQIFLCVVLPTSHFTNGDIS